MSRKIQQSRKKGYSGPLDAAAIAAGINAARRNSQRLAADARILLDAGRYPSACSLATLAIEEAGKVSILRRLAVEHTEKGIADAWRDYRSHRSKNGAWILPELAARGATKLGDLAPAVDAAAEHTEILDRVKQLGFYTDCFTQGHWSEPSAVVKQSLAENLVGTAELLCKGDAISVREIELWIEHLGAAWGTGEMSHALVRWAAAMERERLGKATAAEYEHFVFGTGTSFQRTKGNKDN